ncbi:MAG TPA: competence/damage-inducible protein A [Acidimicrobiia bacterium]|nr:competence/damage-inducible protein A [Acidimicrobiia bacterium]
MKVEVIAVGTELLLGQIVNGNAAEIGRRLAEAGLDHYHQVVVGDNLGRASTAISQALARADAVIITGGLGPTQDDITREAICAAAGVEMAYSEDFAERLREWWSRRRGRDMPANNLRQAEYPQGAVLLTNPRGTAPGLRLPVGRAWLFALPGVPQEMLPMLEEDVIPFLVKEAGGPGVLASRLIRCWGESESGIAERLGDLFETSTNPTVAFLASAAEIKVRLTARAGTGEEAAALLDPLEGEVRRRLGRAVFAVGEETIERLVLRLCRERGWKLGTAESATGGMVAQRVTSVPGASEAFVGSIVAYTAALKTSLLGVPAEVIAEEGVVSEEVALAMAEGGAPGLGADVVVAVTGSAGPEPGGAPVGTMVVAVRTPERSAARTFLMPPDRERARAFASTAALQAVRLALTGEWW